jgi:hypothetical protein
MGGGHDIATRGYPEEQVHKIVRGVRWTSRLQGLAASAPGALSTHVIVTAIVIVIAGFDQCRF